MQPFKLLVYLASSVDLADFGSFGLKGKSFAVFRESSGELIVGGHKSSEYLRESILSAAARKITAKSKEVLPLVCDAIMKNDKHVWFSVTILT